MLLRMYLRWAERHRFKTEILEATEGEEAGLKSVSFSIDGRWAYGRLRSERGVHRLVRISPYDSQKRRHTSFALVEVMPEVPEDAAGRDRRQGPARRHLPGQRRRRPARQQDRLGRAADPPPDRDRGGRAERAQPAPEPRSRDGGAARQAHRAADGGARGRDGAAARRARRGRVGQPDPQLRAPAVHDGQGPAHRRRDSNPTAVLDGDLDAFIEGYLRGSARASRSSARVAGRARRQSLGGATHGRRRLARRPRGQRRRRTTARPPAFGTIDGEPMTSLLRRRARIRADRRARHQHGRRRHDLPQRQGRAGRRQRRHRRPATSSSWSGRRARARARSSGSSSASSCRRAGSVRVAGRDLLAHAARAGAGTAAPDRHRVPGLPPAAEQDGVRRTSPSRSR